MRRSVLALLILCLGAEIAAADVVYYAFPKRRGVGKALRRKVALLVKQHILSAGHRLGPKRKAKYVLKTVIAKKRRDYRLVVRFGPKKAKHAREIRGMATTDLLAVLSDLLGQVMPTKPEDILPLPTPAAAPGPSKEPTPTPPPAATPLVAKVEPEVPKKAEPKLPSRPFRWPDIYNPGTDLAPFPEPVDPPPRIGERD